MSHLISLRTHTRVVSILVRSNVRSVCLYPNSQNICLQFFEHHGLIFWKKVLNIIIIYMCLHCSNNIMKMVKQNDFYILRTNKSINKIYCVCWVGIHFPTPDDPHSYGSLDEIKNLYPLRNCNWSGRRVCGRNLVSPTADMFLPVRPRG